ncbi:enoyl-CoA hydratase/isomerase family protein [Rhodococcus sp. KRD162]|uniref:enoyl-CoA hydratase/isomerase family protein n=1 Tax=unclassified Rhodococcus (in: high G+C Gram-positive bacteria) TaxID=192944 RepID=UPI0019D308C5|nr:enoyl-CoA hydratase-related protein [Rhodococcus sp. KRD162]
MSYSEADISSKVSIEDGVLRIVVATEAGGASLDLEGIEEGTSTLRSVNAGEIAIGSVLLIGRGTNFCAGGNVRDFADAADRGAFVRSVADTFHAFVRELAAVTVPIVAGVHGWAAGAGMSLVCLTDIAIGGPSTKLRPAYPSIGFTPDGAMSWTLPRIVGSGRAMEMLLNDSTINGEEAVRLGILSRLVGDDHVDSEAERLARTLAVGPTSAYQGIKKLLQASESATLAEQLDAESASVSAAAASPEGREGVDAFVEKRRPDFS